jgi:hypothetical protein
MISPLFPALNLHDLSGLDVVLESRALEFVLDSQIVGADPDAHAGMNLSSYFNSASGQLSFIFAKLCKFRGASFMLPGRAGEQLIQNFVLIGFGDLLYPADSPLNAASVIHVGC